MKRPLLSLGFTVKAVCVLEQQAVMKRIVITLKSESYIIEKRTADKIYFKDDAWRIRHRNTFFKNADGGLFVVTPLNEGGVINYTYYVSFLTEAVITAIVLLAMLLTSPFILLFVVGLLIQLAIKIYTLQAAAQNLIDIIIATEK